MLYHNRDITHEEVRLILDSSRPRERAFYAIMAQSGLRPFTICNLKYENIKEDLENNIIPCKIEIPQEIAKGKYHAYFTFIGDEAVKYLRSYLVIRPKIKDEDYLFLSDDGQKNTSSKSISKFFAQTVKKLPDKELMTLKQKKKTKPHDVRLYNLRKFFRKYANQAGFEFVQFWMGHTVNAGQDDHYRPKDVEFHRKLYAEKAAPDIRIDSETPRETEKALTSLKQENEDLKERLQLLENKIDTIIKMQSEAAKIREGFRWEEIVDKFILERESLKERVDKLEGHTNTDEEIEWEKKVNQLKMQIEDSKRQR